MQMQIPEQLNCPICMSILKIPITTQCGHSFCRSCLINASKTKKVCPICRKQFQNSPQKLKQDDILSSILDDLRNKFNYVKKTQSTLLENKIEIMLLLDVKTQNILLPYNKISVSFQLENPALLNKLEKFVARQESPFNKFGVISRIVSLNKLRYNVYECILEGKAFCVIEEDSIEQGLSQMQQDYTYRTCRVKQIIQNSNLNSHQFNMFLKLFKQIKDRDILVKIYRQIDHKVFQLANDPIAMFYSIIGILQLQQKQKYEIVTSFNDEKRIQAIRKVTENVKHDVSYNIKGFLNVTKGTGYVYNLIISMVIVFLIIFLMNSGGSLSTQSEQNAL